MMYSKPPASLQTLSGLLKVFWFVLAVTAVSVDLPVLAQTIYPITPTATSTNNNRDFGIGDAMHIEEAYGSTTAALWDVNEVPASNIYNTTANESEIYTPPEPDPRSVIYTGYVTESQKETAYLVIVVIILPLVSISGIIGNIISFLVFWWKQKMRTVAMKFLMIMAVSDVLVLLLGVLLAVVGFLHYTNPVAEQNVAAYGFAYTGWFIFSLGSNTTVSLTLFSTFERFIAIFFPFKARGNLLHRHQNKIIFSIVLLNVAIALPMCWKYDVVKLYHARLQTDAYFMLPSQLFTKTNFFPMYDLVTAITFRYAPMILLFIFNIAIIARVKQSMKFRGNLQEESKNDPAKSQQEIQITHVLVTVSLVFCACKIPICASRILAVYLPGFNMLQKEHFLYEVFTWSSLTAECVNSAVNFYIYLWFSDSFRSDLKRLCVRTSVGNKLDRTTSQRTMTSVTESAATHNG